MLSRRQFSKVLLAAGGSVLASDGGHPAAAAPAPQNTDQKYDLLIKGGTVIDPGQHLHAAMDVAVKDGKIAEISENIPESRADQVVSAKDHIVTPGFIDLHVHCFDEVANGINADHYCLNRGVTAVVDAGSTGYPLIRRFVKDIVNTSTTRVYALVHIGALGIIAGVQHAMDNPDWVNPQLTAKAAEDNRPAVVGIKVHLGRRLTSHPEELELVFLQRAVEAAELSHLPLMVHISDTYHPLPDILKRMRKGDVYTHCFNNFPHGILDANGKILPEVLEARERGILFDVAEGHFNLSFDVVDKALQQGFLPDTISSDLNEGMENNRVYDLPTMVSKFMALGMDLDAVIERVTAGPARVFSYGLPLGTLRAGEEANLGVFEVRSGSFEFADSVGEKRVGQKKLASTATVCRGRFFVNEV